MHNFKSSRQAVFEYYWSKVGDCTSYQFKNSLVFQSILSELEF